MKGQLTTPDFHHKPSTSFRHSLDWDIAYTSQLWHVCTCAFSFRVWGLGPSDWYQRPGCGAHIFIYGVHFLNSSIKDAETGGSQVLKPTLTIRKLSFEKAKCVPPLSSLLCELYLGWTRAIYEHTRVGGFFLGWSVTSWSLKYWESSLHAFLHHIAEYVGEVGEKKGHGKSKLFLKSQNICIDSIWRKMKKLWLYPETFSSGI